MSAECIDLKIVRETDKAYLLREERKNREPVEQWVPKSMIEYQRKQVGLITIKIPEWLADEKGFTYQ